MQRIDYTGDGSRTEDVVVTHGLARAESLLPQPEEHR